MKKLLIIIAILFLGFQLYKYFLKYPYRYVGYFYPDIENMEYWDESGAFGSVNECKEWVDKMVVKYKATNFDYECGKDCYKGDPYDQNNLYTCRTSVQ